MKKSECIIPKNESQELDRELQDLLVQQFATISSVISNSCLTEQQYKNAVRNLMYLPGVLFIKKIKP